MQFRVISAFITFIGSYLPLAMILAIQDIPIKWWQSPFCNPFKISSCSFIPFMNPVLSILFIVVTLIAVLLSNSLLNKISMPFDAQVESSKPIPSDIINYVFPYVVAFMGLSYNTPDKLLGFLVFILLMFAITYKSGQIIMNPILLMFGWQLFEAKININNHVKEVRILKKGNLHKGNYKVQTIQNFYIAKDK